MTAVAHLLPEKGPVGAHPVEDAVRRAVGDQHVRVRGDQAPALPEGLALPRQIECPRLEPWLPGRTPEAEALDLAAGILQVDDPGFLQVEARQRGLLLKKSVMVPGYHNFPAVGQAPEPLRELVDFPLGPQAAEVPGVDEHVAVRHAQPLVLLVCVGDAHDPHRAPRGASPQFDILRGSPRKQGISVP